MKEISGARAWLKVGCPFSFKFLLFMSEARLLDRIEVLRCDPEDPNFESIKAMLTEALGRPATFPTVEVEPGRFQSDSDELIGLYSEQHRIIVNELAAFTFYKDSIFPQLLELHEMKQGG